MTFSPDSRTRQIPGSTTALSEKQLVQSRELGTALPIYGQDGQKKAPAPSPFAKSWTHFIAGGYDVSFHLNVTDG